MESGAFNHEKGSCRFSIRIRARGDGSALSARRFAPTRPDGSRDQSAGCSESERDESLLYHERGQDGISRPLSRKLTPQAEDTEMTHESRLLEKLTTTAGKVLEQNGGEYVTRDGQVLRTKEEVVANILKMLGI